MSEHRFLFEPGNWQGSGHVLFSVPWEQLDFETTWEVKEAQEGCISCLQRVHILGINERVENHFSIFSVAGGKFALRLENEVLGQVRGEGVVTPDTLAWEIRKQPEIFDGFEVYKRQDDEHYEFKAEFSSPEQMRTQVKGRLWKAH